MSNAEDLDEQARTIHERMAAACPRFAELSEISQRTGRDFYSVLLESGVDVREALLGENAEEKSKKLLLELGPCMAKFLEAFAEHHDSAAVASLARDIAEQVEEAELQEKTVASVRPPQRPERQASSSV